MSRRDVRVVLCPCSTLDAPRIARTVLEEQLVDRVDVLTGVAQASGADQSLLVLKTPGPRISSLEQRLSEMNPAGGSRMLRLESSASAQTVLSWGAKPQIC